MVAAALCPELGKHRIGPHGKLAFDKVIGLLETNRRHPLAGAREREQLAVFYGFTAEPFGFPEGCSEADCPLCRVCDFVIEFY
jgi:hypothetical protein